MSQVEKIPEFAVVATIKDFAQYSKTCLITDVSLQLSLTV